jgi:hypothetical protein
MDHYGLKELVRLVEHKQKCKIVLIKRYSDMKNAKDMINDIKNVLGLKILN